MTRRSFIQDGLFCMAGLSAGKLLAADLSKKPALSIGLLTDLHYADKPTHGTRFYRDTLGKLTEAVDSFNRDQPGLVIELGDLIDQGESPEQEIKWLETIEKVYARTKSSRHYVLGNHCVTSLTKAELVAHTGAARTPHYSLDQGGAHIVILDACYRADGESYQPKNFVWTDSAIPAAELDWLRSDLAGTRLPVIVFVHQRLDENGKHSVVNAAAVRTVLEQSGKVLAVFQGHSHQNDYQQIGNIHYCTLVAMVEGAAPEQSGYARLDVMEDSSLRLHGFRQQKDHTLQHAIS